MVSANEPSDLSGVLLRGFVIQPLQTMPYENAINFVMGHRNKSYLFVTQLLPLKVEISLRTRSIAWICRLNGSVHRTGLAL